MQLSRHSSGSDPFCDEISRQIHERSLFKKGERILVAVSGGVDSVVLLHSLIRILQAPKSWLAVAHFNHHLRGRASSADARFVERLARRLGLEYHGGEGDVRTRAEEQGLSLEMAARQLRLRFLASAARERGCRLVATAHHMDDQAELFFLRAARGAGGEGLAGMGWSDPSPLAEHPEIRIVRPLLGHSKGEIMTWAVQQGVPFREDATNAQDICLRNRVRKRILPLWLREMGTGALPAVCRTQEIVGAETEYVAWVAHEWLRNSREVAFDALHEAVQRQVLRLQILEMGIPADFGHVETLRKGVDRPVCVPGQSGGRSLQRDAQGRLCWVISSKTNTFSAGSVEGVLEGRRGRLNLEGGAIHWVLLRHPGASRVPRNLEGGEVFDGDRVGRQVILRHWQPGDRFRPLGLRGSAKLQDLFVNLKVPSAERRCRWLACRPDGQIFWVQGLRPSEDFKVSDSTRECLVWRLESCA